MLFAQMICRGKRIVFLTQLLATFWQQLYCYGRNGGGKGKVVFTQQSFFGTVQNVQTYEVCTVFSVNFSSGLKEDTPIVLTIIYDTLLYIQ